MIKLLLVGTMLPFIQLMFTEYLLLPDPGIKYIAVNRQKANKQHNAISRYINGYKEIQSCIGE